MDDMMLGYVLGKSQGGGVTPTGSIDITKNGTYDVSDKAEAVVNVDSSNAKFTKYGFPYDEGEWKNTDYGITHITNIGGNYSQFYYTSGITKITLSGEVHLGTNYCMAYCPSTITILDATNATITDVANYTFVGSRFTTMIFGENCTKMGSGWWTASNPAAEIHFYGNLNSFSPNNHGGTTDTTHWYLHYDGGVIPLSGLTNLRQYNKFHVPAALYDEYCNATNWADIPSQIVGDL